ncbi:hypothetical protein B0H11DRAFT_2234408 [Mycena galericulata]|nr:hypothetical protein B0H11DRAFT_2234408 [Mycena galericulata]
MLCGYDPSVDKYRLSILKGHLEGAALEWFMQSVNSPHFAQGRELTFTDALCALHQRFVTSANAQRATRAFEAVRFDNQKGPDNFAESLLKRANAMHHVPDEFVINQKFLAGLPRDIRYKLKVDREMTAEYTPFPSLRNSARQLWTAMNEDTPPVAVNPRTSAPSTARNAPAAPAPRRASTAPELQAPHRAPLPPRTVGSEDTRTCFECGAVGHIGTNPRCPRYNDPPIVPGARVCTQRVLESYADGHEAPHDEYAAEDPEEAADEELEGLWGGEQYMPDEEDPNTAPDLEALMPDDDEPVRVGALYARHFALRIEEPEEDADEERYQSGTVPINPDSVPAPRSAAMLDLDQLQLRIPGNQYPEWDAAEEARLAQIAADQDHSLPTFAGILWEFEARTGSRVLSRARSLELESINAVGAEESARDVWRRLIRLQPPLLLGFSARDLRTTAVDVDDVSLQFSDRIFEARQYQQDLLDLLARRLDTRLTVERLAAAPSASDPRAGNNFTRANDENHRLSADIERHVHHVERHLATMLEAQSLVNEELTRRLLAREALALETIVPDPPSPSTRTLAYSAVVEDRDGESSTSVSESTADVVPTESSAELSTNTSTSSPSSIGSSPPPSYPGTPETGGSHASSNNLWKELSDHAAAINSISPEHEPSPEEIAGDRGEMVEETHEVDTRIGFPSPPATPTDPDRDPIPGEPPRMISRAVYLFGAISAEYVTTFLRSDGTVFVEYSPLPDSHYLHEEFRAQHAAAMNFAITEHALDLGVPRDEVRQLVMSPRNIGD